MTALLLVCRGRKWHSKLEHPTKNGGPPACESEIQVDAGASWVTGPEYPVGQAVIDIKRRLTDRNQLWTGHERQEDQHPGDVKAWSPARVQERTARLADGSHANTSPFYSGGQ